MRARTENDGKGSANGGPPDGSWTHDTNRDWAQPAMGSLGLALLVFLCSSTAAFSGLSMTRLGRSPNQRRTCVDCFWSRAEPICCSNGDAAGVLRNWSKPSVSDHQPYEPMANRQTALNSAGYQPYELMENMQTALINSDG